MDLATIGLWTLACVLVAGGMAGLVLPALPGAPLLLAGLVLAASIGAVVGLFFGLVGVLVGPFLGAVLGELTVRRDLGAAGRAGVGAAIGLALGTAAKLALGFAMLGIALFMRFV